MVAARLLTTEIRLFACAVTAKTTPALLTSGTQTNYTAGSLMLKYTYIRKTYSRMIWQTKKKKTQLKDPENILPTRELIWPGYEQVLL
jgi:hypothetical protein